MDINLSASEEREFLRIARQTIASGCTTGTPPEPPTHKSATFQQRLATFVTLQKRGELRGCIGSLQAHRSLLEDVVHNAYASAFLDHRFFPVTENELMEISIEISILTPMSPIPVATESELLAELKPGVDGLVIENDVYKATFLPQVWEQLPAPEDFLNHLKQKAGIPAGTWPDDMRCFRYHCIKLYE